MGLTRPEIPPLPGDELAVAGPVALAVVPEPGGGPASAAAPESAPLDAGADALGLVTRVADREGDPAGAAHGPAPAVVDVRAGVDRVGAALPTSSSLSVPTPIPTRLRSPHAGRPTAPWWGHGSAQAARRLGISRRAFLAADLASGRVRGTLQARRSVSVGRSPLVVLPFPGAGPIPAGPAAWTWPVGSARRRAGVGPGGNSE